MIAGNRRLLPSLACALAVAAATPLAADTLQDFDAPGTHYTFGQFLQPPPPAVQGGGPTGNFLRLAFATADPPNHNTVDFPRTRFGPACTVTARFDFRVTPGSGRADGLGFALLSTGAYGNDGVAAPQAPHFAAEEPDFARSLGVGFDVYQNAEIGDLDDNHVSLHFDGARLAQVPAGPLVDLASGAFLRAEVVIAARAGTVTVRLTPSGGGPPVTVIDQQPVPGLAPYEGRVHFGARSGGLAADHDLDNVAVTFTGCPSAEVGAWSAPAPWPVVAIHAHLLPTGQVMFWDRHDYPDTDSIPRLWDPASGQFTLLRPPGVDYDVFCSGHSFLADGRLLVAGGHVMDLFGLAKATLYDPFTDQWQQVGDMAAARWYPTNTTLADGDVLVVSGTINSHAWNRVPEVYDSATGGWRLLSGAERQQPFYPFMFLAPDGGVFDAGPAQTTYLLDPTGAGAWKPVGDSHESHRDYGTAVAYDDGKVLLLGGSPADVDNLPPTRSAEVIDLRAPTPAWRLVEPMAHPRRQLNATLLPDGRILVTGGTSAVGFNNATGAVHTAEVWDPETERWTAWAGMAVPRLYHSTALLLPDGRVLSAGGGHPSDTAHLDPDHFDAEVFSPPYLFAGPRPALIAAPEAVAYGARFTALTPDAARITKVHWLRLGSVTHAFNQNQRICRSTFFPTPGGVGVAAPSDPNLCPPGHYLLFLLDGAGVPSTAQVVRLGDCADADVCGVCGGDGTSCQLFSDGFESGDASGWSGSVP